ncbi:MAG TPA: LysM domain-containing protein [Gammaproteobacteria bacterium]|nr:LysM domain-containing protein [Gammaproteobacteria bacterium]
MTDPLKAFLQANALDTPAFPPDSRYHGLETAQWTRPDGEPMSYVRRRFIPPPEQHALLHEVRIAQGDRPDTLAARELGDAEQYWRLCDANAVLRPTELTETLGRRIRVTLPAGVPGGKDV